MVQAHSRGSEKASVSILLSAPGGSGFAAGSTNTASTISELVSSDSEDVPSDSEDVPSPSERAGGVVKKGPCTKGMTVGWMIIDGASDRYEEDLASAVLDRTMHDIGMGVGRSQKSCVSSVSLTTGRAGVAGMLNKAEEVPVLSGWKA